MKDVACSYSDSDSDFCSGLRSCFDCGFCLDSYFYSGSYSVGSYANLARGLQVGVAARSRVDL